jgi:tRNA-specific 2-thiouridylase
MNNGKKHIVVGLSGGVDSSVTALLLKENGFRVTAVFMQNWEADREDPHCSAMQDLSDARAVCNKLNIELRTVNFAAEYWERIFQYFLDELAAGRTPNPDILCNQEIKFKAFLHYALEIGAELIATGHYASLNPQANLTYLQKSLDQSKDQTYFLHRLNQYQLSHSLFPLGDIDKKTVREIAARAGLINHNKKDSTGICFIGERKFRDFISEYLLAQPGSVETAEGKILGQHQGLMFYTLGQRQGLGIGGLKKFPEGAWYVVGKDLKQNKLIVAQDSYHPLLMSSQLVCNQVHWIAEQPAFPLSCKAKIRHRQEDQDCQVYSIDPKTYRVEFNHPQRAVTPGQSVVFYHDEICLGGGIIL